MSKTTLATLARTHPEVLKLLHDEGIHFCAGCYLTLTSSPEKAAAYHGVPDVRKFMRRLHGIVHKKPKRRLRFVTPA